MALENNDIDLDINEERDNDDVEIDDEDKEINDELNKKTTVAGPSDALLRRKPKKLIKNKDTIMASGYIHSPRSWKNSRRSRNGYGRGLPKKKGAGGKGVWGVPGSELMETYEDVNDPNFDNENMSNGDIMLKAVVPDEPNLEMKKKLEPIILEYFENGDTHEAAIAIEERIPQKRRDVVIEQAIEMAMDHKPSHRELTSILISDLFNDCVNVDDITKAFENLLANIDDLILDIPDAPTIIGNFIARAIADDCIPPKFITNTKEKSDNVNIQTSLDRANTLLSMEHGLIRLHNVWGVGGALRPVKLLTKQMTLLLQEFLCSGDIEEASRCLRGLEVPHFHHELVYEAIIIAMESNREDNEEALCKLLKSLDQAILITPEQMERGFMRVFDDLPDIEMDVPRAHFILDRFVNRCQKEGFLPIIVTQNLPIRGRKRFVSEGDQQLNKNTRIS